MQPEPPAVPQNEPTETSTQQTTASTQHGLHDSDATVSLSPAEHAGAGTTTSTPSEQIAADAAFAASVQGERDVPAQESRRLSPKSTPSPPAGRNRITEYEKASTPPIKKREGPVFEVIKKYRSPNDKSSPIQELPNGTSRGGVLTYSYIADIDLRGLDACTCPPVSDRLDLSSPGLEALPRASHRTARVEKRVCSFLPWP